MEKLNQETYSKQFTDRVEARELFWKEYQKLSTEINEGKTGTDPTQTNPNKHNTPPQPQKQK